MESPDGCLVLNHDSLSPGVFTMSRKMQLVPYVAGKGVRSFEDDGKSFSFDLLSSNDFTSGLQLDYRRQR